MAPRRALAAALLQLLAASRAAAQSQCEDGPRTSDDTGALALCAGETAWASCPAADGDGVRQCRAANASRCPPGPSIDRTRCEATGSGATAAVRGARSTLAVPGVSYVC